MLQDGGPDHGERGDDETSTDLFQGSEPDTLLAEEGVDKGVHD